MRDGEPQMETDSGVVTEGYEVLVRTRTEEMRLKSWRAERGQLTVNTPSRLCLSLNGSEGFSSSCHAPLCWCCHYGGMENAGAGE